jgi:hypothetical protein
MIYAVVGRKKQTLQLFATYSAMEQFVVQVSRETGRPDWCVVYAYEQDLDEYKPVFRYLLDVGNTLIRLPLES